MTQKVKRTDTFIYDFQYRRVAVNPDSLQVSANLIPLLSPAGARGRPGADVVPRHAERRARWTRRRAGIRRCRSSWRRRSSGRRRTSTRWMERTRATTRSARRSRHIRLRGTRGLVSSEISGRTRTSAMTRRRPASADLLDTNASCNAGAAAGAAVCGRRDLASRLRDQRCRPARSADRLSGGRQGGVRQHLELRLPPPVLPIVGKQRELRDLSRYGQCVSASVGHVPELCALPSAGPGRPAANVSGKIGTCNFNYFSHAVGLGARYKTPVGPIRVDFSYNLNPPVYPVIYDFNNSPPLRGAGEPLQLLLQHRTELLDDARRTTDAKMRGRQLPWAADCCVPLARRRRCGTGRPRDSGAGRVLCWTASLLW